MFKRVGRWLRRIDGWFFRLTDKQRVGVVLGTALFLFSSALYCLGIGSVVLLQRPYEVSAAVPATTVDQRDETARTVELSEAVSTPTSLPTPNPTAGSPPPTPIAAVEIAEPPALPRASIYEPPARPRVVGPDVKPEAPSQRLATAVPPTQAPVIAQPTPAQKPNTASTTVATPPQATRVATSATGVSKQPTPTTGSQPAPASKSTTAVPKPGQPTSVPRAQVAPTRTNR
jgi:hypothetical protein